MAIKESTRKSLRIISATAMCVFSFMSIIIGSAAWFLANKNVNSSGDDFNVKRVNTAVQSIYVHKYYGTLGDDEHNDKRFCFKPTADSSIEFIEGQQTYSTSISFTMETFKLLDPNHPVLFVFKVNGGNETIRFITEYPYIAKAKESYSQSVAHYSNLSSITTDGVKIRVEEDENEGNAETIYQCHHPSGESATYELIWMDLKQNGNPLSSAVKTSYVLKNDVTYSGNAQTSISTDTIEYNGNPEYYIPVATSSLTERDDGSFVTFPNGNLSYSKTATAFEGSTQGYTYLYVVLDYNPASLEYFYYHFLGRSELETIGGVGFSCDWDLEV